MAKRGKTNMMSRKEKHGNDTKAGMNGTFLYRPYYYPISRLFRIA